MPPKGKTAERLQQEAEAQRARAAALQYLTKTGSGPSQKEIAQQQKEREKWTNPTTQAVQQRLAHLQPVQASGAGNAPTGDNTLAVMAAHRARQMLQGGGVHARENSLGDSGAQSFSGGAWGNGVGAHSDTKSDLPDGWKLAVDPSSGDTYYWNEKTKETSWERPQGQNNASDNVQANDDGEEELEEGWEQVEDPQSGQPYYWHRASNETTWTKPVKTTVSLKQAREAKSKLDAILKMCGPSKKSSAGEQKRSETATHKPPPQLKSNSSAGESASRKRDAGDGDDGPTKKARVSS